MGVSEAEGASVGALSVALDVLVALDVTVALDVDVFVKLDASVALKAVVSLAVAFFVTALAKKELMDIGCSTNSGASDGEIFGNREPSSE